MRSELLRNQISCWCSTPSIKSGSNLEPSGWQCAPNVTRSISLRLALARWSYVYAIHHIRAHFRVHYALVQSQKRLGGQLHWARLRRRTQTPTDITYLGENIYTVRKIFDERIPPEPPTAAGKTVFRTSEPLCDDCRFGAKLFALYNIQWNLYSSVGF